MRAGASAWRAPSTRCVVRDEDGADDRRAITFDVELSARPSRSALNSESLRSVFTVSYAGDAVRQAVEDQDGQVVPGLGRLTTARVISSEVDEDARRRQFIKLRARFVAISQPPATAEVAMPSDDEENQPTAPATDARRDPREADVLALTHPGVNRL